jgi:hypothetical protein
MHTRLQATQILLLYKGMHRDKIEVVLPPLRTPAAYASLILLFYMSEMSFQGREKFLPFSREKRWSPPFGGKKREIWQDRFLLLIFFFFSGSITVTAIFLRIIRYQCITFRVRFRLMMAGKVNYLCAHNKG